MYLPNQIGKQHAVADTQHLRYGALGRVRAQRSVVAIRTTPQPVRLSRPVVQHQPAQPTVH